MSEAGRTHLKMTGRVIVSSDERSGTSEESVGSRGDNDTLGLSLLADRRREALVSDLLALGKRLSGKTSLIDRDVDGIVETAVGGNDVSDLEGDDISGNELRRFDFRPGTVTAALGLGRERLHKSLDSVTGRSLLVESDTGVDEEEEDDTDEILPVWGSASTVRESDGDKGSSLHDPREGVPHEAAGEGEDRGNSRQSHSHSGSHRGEVGEVAYERNWRKAEVSLCSSLLGPKMSRRRSASELVKPSSLHLHTKRARAYTSARVERVGIPTSRLESRERLENLREIEGFGGSTYWRRVQTSSSSTCSRSTLSLS